MGLHRLGHQQSVRGGRRRPPVPILLVLLAVLALPMACVPRIASDGGPSEAARRHVPLRLPARGVSGSSSETFLKDLESSGAGGAGVAWRADGGVVDLARDVLGRYRARSGARLAASGYLDLAGNAWGALVVVDGSAVDIALVTEDEGAGALARVIRLEGGK